MSGKQTWLILSHGFNMDGRAASQTITDKIPHLLKAGVEPIVLSAITGRKDKVVEHHQLLPAMPVALRFDLRSVRPRSHGACRFPLSGERRFPTHASFHVPRSGSTTYWPGVY